MANLVRLQKFIADCGVTSRRKAEDLIVAGKIRVNGEVQRTLGTKVDPNNDIVEMDKQILDPGSVHKIYAVLHKPRGYMTTLNDPEGRPTVMKFCKEVTERIYPVGRLDYLSEGLLIMTNDGDFANMVAHPSFEVTKVYEVKVFGAINQTLLRKLQKGVMIDGVLAKPMMVRIVKQLHQKTWLEFRLQEGRNREIRKICEAAGLTVDKLKRVAIEGLTIQGIAPGKICYYQKSQLMRLLAMNNDGSRKSDSLKFFSEKKTVKLSKRKNSIQIKKATPADSEIFQMFRKDSYFEATKILKQKRIDAAKKPKRVRDRDLFELDIAGELTDEERRPKR